MCAGGVLDLGTAAAAATTTTTAAAAVPLAKEVPLVNPWLLGITYIIVLLKKSFF